MLESAQLHFVGLRDCKNWEYSECNVRRTRRYRTVNCVVKRPTGAVVAEPLSRKFMFRSSNILHLGLTDIQRAKAFFFSLLMRLVILVLEIVEWDILWALNRFRGAIALWAMAGVIFRNFPIRRNFLKSFENFFLGPFWPSGNEQSSLPLWSR